MHSSSCWCLFQGHLLLGLVMIHECECDSNKGFYLGCPRRWFCSVFLFLTCTQPTRLAHQAWLTLTLILFLALIWICSWLHRKQQFIILWMSNISCLDRGRHFQMTFSDESLSNTEVTVKRYKIRVSALPVICLTARAIVSSAVINV